MSRTDDSLLEFPCSFAVKAMGLASDDFQALVTALVTEHTGALSRSAVTTRPSANGKYLSVTVTFTAHSKPQLDAIYQALSDHERVLMAL